MKKIAAKLNKRMQKDKGRKIYKLDEIKASKEAAEEALSTVKSTEELMAKGHAPVASAYHHAQNLLSVLVEGLLLYPELNRFSQILEDAEDLYMPGWPPMSPVSDSFFYTWGSFDLVVGLQKESLVSIICELSHQFKLPASLIEVFRLFEHSKMSVYEYEGFQEGHCLLRELHTNKQFIALNESGYTGRLGELWYVRLLPDISRGEKGALCYTSPYIITESVESWHAFIHRQSWKKDKKSMDYNSLLKSGATPTYWLEYVTQAYSGVDSNNGAIFLKGFPDQGHTRPHADIDSSGKRLPDHQAFVHSIE